MEHKKRDAEKMDGSAAVFRAASGKHGTLGHGQNIITQKTRDQIDALRKELGLDVAMSAADVLVEARQQLHVEDLELPFKEDAARLFAALRSAGQIAARPLR